MSKYPLINELGLTIYSLGGRDSWIINADDLERILREGVRVQGHEYDHDLESNKPSKRLKSFYTPGFFAPHQIQTTGLVINIKPSTPETAESLLRELVEDLVEFEDKPISFVPGLDFLKRARKLLEQK